MTTPPVNPVIMGAIVAGKLRHHNPGGDRADAKAKELAIDCWLIYLAIEAEAKNQNRTL